MEKRKEFVLLLVPLSGIRIALYRDGAYQAKSREVDRQSLMRSGAQNTIQHILQLWAVRVVGIQP